MGLNDNLLVYTTPFSERMDILYYIHTYFVHRWTDQTKSSKNRKVTFVSFSLCLVTFFPFPPSSIGQGRGPKKAWTKFDDKRFPNCTYHSSIRLDFDR